MPRGAPGSAHVAAGGDPDYTVILDNYCWGNTRDPQCLGELVRATEALCALAMTSRTPSASGTARPVHTRWSISTRTDASSIAPRVLLAALAAGRPSPRMLSQTTTTRYA